MRRYETVVIVDPDLTEEGRQPLQERIQDLIAQHKGVLLVVDPWGSRQLAYPINKKNRGYYVRYDYCADGELVKELERYFRITDGFLKYMTVLLEKEADPDRILEQIAEAKAKAEAAVTGEEVTEDKLDSENADEDTEEENPETDTDEEA